MSIKDQQYTTESCNIGEYPYYNTNWWGTYPYTYQTRDYRAEHMKELKGYLRGYLDARKAALTKDDLEKITKRLEEFSESL